MTSYWYILDMQVINKKSEEFQNHRINELGNNEYFEVIDHLAKIDTTTREFYIKAVLEIYYLLNDGR